MGEHLDGTPFIDSQGRVWKVVREWRTCPCGTSVAEGQTYCSVWCATGHAVDEELGP